MFGSDFGIEGEGRGKEEGQLPRDSGDSREERKAGQMSSEAAKKYQGSGTSSREGLGKLGDIRDLVLWSHLSPNKMLF